MHTDTRIMNSNLNQLGRLGIGFIPRPLTSIVNFSEDVHGEGDDHRRIMELMQSSPILQDAATSNLMADWIQNPRDTRSRVMLNECSVVLHWVTKTLMKQSLTEHNLDIIDLMQKAGSSEEPAEIERNYGRQDVHHGKVIGRKEGLEFYFSRELLRHPNYLR